MIGLDEDISNSTIEIRKAYKTKLLDAIIVATALVNTLTIVTRNTKDFDEIEGLEVLNSFNI